MMIKDMDQGAAADDARPSGHPGIADFIHAAVAGIGHAAIVAALIGVAAIAVTVRSDQHPPTCKAGSVAAIFTNCEIEQ